MKLKWVAVILLFGMGIVFFTSCKADQKKEHIDNEIMEVTTGEYLKENFQAKNGEIKYRILYPKGFDQNQKHPVLLFLHGSGERGDDNEAQLVHGSEMIQKGMETHKGIVIFPQCPKEDYWVNLIETEATGDDARDFIIDEESPPTKALGQVIELIEEMVEKPYVDNSRLYVGGLSMGGMGTFELCWRKPDLFAAAVPICGAGSPSKAELFADLPIRIYHGEDDVVVSVDESLKMIEALKKLGGEPESFIYPGVNHNSWDNAFAEPDFLEWIFKQKKSSVKKG